jgi:hypothetical protein
VYDDAERFTICPHSPIFADPQDLERKKLGISLLGKTIRCAHQVDVGPDRRVHTLHWNGMVEIDGLVGEFAPHLFVVCTPEEDKNP